MKSFVTYCRVSTTNQGREGLGMASQIETVRRYVQAHGGQTVREFLEVESGGKTDAGRPQLAEALALSKKCKGVLVVAKLDRLSRNAEFLLRLQNAGVDFVCCDCPNVDRFTVGILALVAQRERELISERTKAALQMAKQRGVKLGAVNPERQVKLMNEGARKGKEEFAGRILPIIREIQSTGVKTLQGVADCLNRRGILTRRGCQFVPTQIHLLLKA